MEGARSSAPWREGEERYPSRSLPQGISDKGFRVGCGRVNSTVANEWGTPTNTMARLNGTHKSAFAHGSVGHIWNRQKGRLEVATGSLRE